MIGRVPDATRSSPQRRKPGWWRWLARRPRSWVIRTNCGPPGCWPRMPVVTGRPPVIRAWRNWPRGRSARSWQSRTSRRRGCAITWKNATRSSSPRWRKSSASTAKWRCCAPALQTATARAQKAVTQGALPSFLTLAIISYDEKPGIQAIGTTAPDRPPLPGISPTVMRDHEYKRHGTLTLMAGIDLLTGNVHAVVKERHRSREFIEFLKLLDAAYPADTAIEVILDNH